MGNKYPKLKVAAVQTAPVFLDREGTVEKACHLIQEAGANCADLIVFPECFIPAFPYWYRFYPASHPNCLHFNRELFKNAVEIPSECTERICQAAKKANTYVVMGLNERRPRLLGTLYNTQLFIHREGYILGKHQKLMPSFFERMVHGLGDGSTLCVFPTEYGSVGGLCCGENGNPLFRFVLMCQGEVVHAANWPCYANPFDDGTTYELMLLRARNYALEAKVFVVSAADIFTQETADTLKLDAEIREKIQDWGGHSAIIGPRGQYLAGPAESEETIIYAEINLEEIIEARMWQDFTGHYNRFDIVSLNYNPSTIAPLKYTSSQAINEESVLPPILEEGEAEISESS
ncbi:carbon-nitrogen hydrolase family protein [Chloroflexota bacterium]